MQNLVVAITGASGAIYSLRLLEVLMAAGRNVHVTISPAATQVFEHELGIAVDLDNFDESKLSPSEDDLTNDSKLAPLLAATAVDHAVSSVFEDVEPARGTLTYYHYQDFQAGIASGSFLTSGMVICPCSMGTLSSLANGQSNNLIHRAAEVHLKERRRLIMVPRETPLSSIQLGNMKRLADAGVVVLPATPGFYHNPISVPDLVDFVVGRACDQLGIEQELVKRWGGRSQE